MDLDYGASLRDAGRAFPRLPGTETIESPSHSAAMSAVGALPQNEIVVMGISLLAVAETAIGGLDLDKPIRQTAYTVGMVVFDQSDIGSPDLRALS